MKITTPICLNCGKRMKKAKDSRIGTYTGYLWKCECMPGKIISRG